MTDEALRILLAVQDRRLFRNKRGRFEIDREIPPDRKIREQLRRDGLIVAVYGNDGYRLTATGQGAIKSELYRRVKAKR